MSVRNATRTVQFDFHEKMEREQLQILTNKLATKVDYKGGCLCWILSVSQGQKEQTNAQLPKQESSDLKPAIRSVSV